MTSPPPDLAAAKSVDNNWFERNPKKTICFLLIIVFLMGLLITEKLLQQGFHPLGYGSQRFINLREHKPLFSDYIYPTDDDLQNAEDLERKKYLLRVDPNGYIIPSEVHPDADLTIVFLGGSTTECLYMNEVERFPYVTGRLIENNLNIKVNSFNAAKAGNNSLHSLDILLNKVMPLNPDIVVMTHNINDLIILLFEKSYWNQNKYKAPIVEITPTIGKNLEQSFIIIRDYFVPNVSRALGGFYERIFVKERPTEFPAVKGKTIEIQKSQILQEFRANLEIFLDICRRRHIVPVLMTQANRFTEDPGSFIASMMRRMEIQHGITYNNFKEIFDLFNEQIRTVGKANDVLVIDLASQIPQEKNYLYDTVHLTTRGSSLAGQIIYQHLQSIVHDLTSKNITPRHQ